MLATTRLLTLTGSGGSGKTRLALQVATDLLEEFAHGVWWVELAALSDPLLVPQAVASALGIPERVGCTLTEALSDALRRQHLLFVLDNCEHLLGACRQLIETLLQTCPTLRILTTSREALTITGETVWPVPSLRVPDTYHLPPIEGLLTYEAVQLFVERARSVLPFLHAHTGECTGSGAGMPSSRRHSTGDRAGRGPYTRALCGADRCAIG